MKLPSSFRRFIRKVVQYAGPVGTATVLRGCPCPAPVSRPPQPFTSSIAVDADTTLDATGATWNTWCAKTCGDSFTSCHVQVNTSGGDSIAVRIACNSPYGLNSIAADYAPWMSACKQACHEEQDCLIGPDPTIDNKPPIITCQSWWLNCGGGRHTDGILLLPPMAEDGLGPALAHMAIREAESVFAFQRLVCELKAHRAPRKLRKQAARSRRDEERHMRVMTSLARRHGTTMTPPSAPEKPLPNRPLDEVALENAVEGCVREAYGTWIAWKRAHDTQDPELRATMRRIAMDEARHATLAWNIHRWVMPRLDKNARDRISQAMDAAWKKIATDYPEAEDLTAVKRGIGVC